MRSFLGTDVPLVSASLGWVLLVGALVALVTTTVSVMVQWHRFTRELGAFRCFVRLPEVDGTGGRWRRGAARFDPVALRWFPSYTLLASRSLVLHRCELQLSGRRPARADDGDPPGLTVMAGEVRGRAVELAVPECSASALVLWAESGPPGRGVNVA